MMPPTSESLTNQWIEHNPQVMGGTAVIRVTRMTVYSVADRGRKRRLVSTPPPSEPDLRISRIRLSGRWFYLRED
jgi:hypothetical protein